MKKLRLVFIFILTMVFSFSSFGCDYFWPYDNETEIVLPPQIASGSFSYTTQAVTKGTVTKSRSLTSTFSSFLNTTNPPTVMAGLFLICYADNDKSDLFKQGEKGTIILDDTIPKTAQFGKNIKYDAEVKSITNKDELSVFIIAIIGDYNDLYIKEGTLATFQIIDQEKSDVIVVPRSAVKTYISRNYVGLLKNGCKEDTMITTGLYGTETVEVLSGLSVGDLVIIS
ncbi:MAG: efflux RND transporter periplasmic adaptor subunit [Saccharofermentanales bacterium]